MPATYSISRYGLVCVCVCVCAFVSVLMTTPKGLASPHTNMQFDKIPYPIIILDSVNYWPATEEPSMH